MAYLLGVLVIALGVAASIALHEIGHLVPAKRFGVKIHAPDVNRSGADFEVENGEVVYALGGVRNLGLQAMEHVVAVREEPLAVGLRRLPVSPPG